MTPYCWLKYIHEELTAAPCPEHEGYQKLAILICRSLAAAVCAFSTESREEGDDDLFCYSFQHTSRIKLRFRTVIMT